MRAHERRAAGAYPFFKVATWDTRLCLWRPGKVLYETEAAARKATKKPGRYRVTRFDDGSNCDLEPFSVPA